MVKKITLILALALVAFGLFSLLQRGNRAINVAASPDVGGKIAFASAGSIWMYTGGQAQQLTQGPQDKQDKRDAQPSFSPDGTQIAYVRFDEGYSDLYKLDVSDPPNPVALTDYKPNIETGGVGYAGQALWAMFPAWSPDGERLAFTTDVRTQYPGLYSMSADGEGTPRKLEFLDHSTQAVERPTWSPDGLKIAVANYITGKNIGQIWVLDTTSGKWNELTDSTDGAYDPAWSPDGEWLAFTMRNGTSNNIFVVPTDAEKWTDDYPTPIQLTTDGASRAPAWSPDGNRLAFVGLEDTTFDLYAARISLDANANPILENIERLTENANIDASSGLSWGQ